MNHGILCVETASAETVTCRIVIMPDDMLQLAAPATIYSAEQLAIINDGRACVPTLQSLPDHPSLVEMAAAIPGAIAAGQRLPYLSVILGTDTQTWTAPTTYMLDQGNLTTLCDPAVAVPNIADAWANMASITYGMAGRGLFDPADYDPPVTSGAYDLYFPIMEQWARVKFQPMWDHALSAGGYWYLDHSIFYPAYTYLYTIPMGGDISNHFYITSPSHYSIAYDATWGLQCYWSLTMHGDPPCTCATWRIKGGFGYVYGEGAYGNDWVESITPYHWISNTPAIVVPRSRRMFTGIIAPLAALLLLESLMVAGAASQSPPVRRWKK